MNIKSSKNATVPYTYSINLKKFNPKLICIEILKNSSDKENIFYAGWRRIRQQGNLSSTSAQYFDLQVASDVKAIRMKRLINLTIDKRKSFRDRLIGKERLVLWEECSEIGSRLKWTGLTEDYLRVECFSDNRLHNQISKVKILSLNGEKLLVDLLNSSNES